MVAGFLMGPSLFGWLTPGLQSAVFPAESRHALYVVSQIGVVLYMFCVGLEFRSDLMIRHARRAAAVSIAGIAAPMLLGGGLAVLLMRSGGFFTPQVQMVHAILFVGAALSITAFPVLARIIYERGIAGTALGSLALAAGALDDAAAWIILAVVLGSLSGQGTMAVIAGGGAILYAAGVFGAIRPILIRFEAAVQDRGSLPPWMFPAMFMGLAAAAWFTDLVGIHSVFGAFVLGAATPHGLLSRELQSKIEPLTTALLVPLFFTYSGLNSSIGLVDSAWLWMVTALALLVACAGKGVACFVAARVTGASTREALSVATLMNARGMMELILLNIGLQRGIITPVLFTILVMMTITTTLMAGPLFSLFNSGEPEPATDRDFRLGETS
jgi:Kef-type K+ transport system membrane component KefB